MDNAPYLMERRMTSAEIEELIETNRRLRLAVKQARYALAVAFGDTTVDEDEAAAVQPQPSRSSFNIFKTGKR